MVEKSCATDEERVVSQAIARILQVGLISLRAAARGIRKLGLGLLSAIDAAPAWANERAIEGPGE